MSGGRFMKKIPIFLIIFLFPVLLLSDAGVLIPVTVSDTPDPSILSLYRMEVNIEIKDRIAETKVLQVYRNHTDGILEGQYIFTIPEQAMLKDFAIWDQDVRIPGIIMEKEKARKIYEKLVWQAIDPGLVERGRLRHEVDYFSVNVAPIPPYGTKRVELFYTEELSLNQMNVFYDFPLEPTLFEDEQADSLSISIHIEDKIPLTDFSFSSTSYPFKVTKESKNEINAVFEGREVTFTEDLTFSYRQKFEDISLEILTYRNIEERGELFYLDGLPPPQTGFFAFRVGFNLSDKSGKDGEGQNYLFIFDNSLSMMWKKIETAFYTLSKLTNLVDEEANINIMCFSSGLDTKWERYQPNTGDNRKQLIDFVRSKYISGGTNIEGVINYLKGKEEIVPILITDGYPTSGEIDYQSLLNGIKNIPPIYIVGIGDNCNRTLMENIAKKTGGTYLKLRAFNQKKIEVFFQTLGGGKITDVRLNLSPSSLFSGIYPLPLEPQSIYNGNCLTYTGKYLSPRKKAKATVSYSHNGSKQTASTTFSLPEQALECKEIRRLWARRRVDYLLERIRMEGEKKEWVDEIIALSKEYKFVTPYTSFLAAPRALLRPRIIRPGDPVLIVKADSNIVDIVAVFPFGLTKPMVYHKDEDVWRIRFLVPSDIKDGRYKAVLIMRDDKGNIIREKKTFIIDREPPVLRIELPHKFFNAGETVLIKAHASKDTRRIEASLEENSPFPLVYGHKYLASTGELSIPDNLTTGRYKLKIVAEDFAFNTTYREIEIDVIGN
jgi:Ca-activated chloride channel family protein